MGKSDKIKIESAAYILVPLACAAVAVLISVPFTLWELSAFGHWMVLLSRINLAQIFLYHDEFLHDVVLFCACSVFSLGAYAAGFNLSRIPRIVVMIQLTALSILALYLSWTSAAFFLHPLGLLICLPLGVSIGYGMRTLKKGRERQEAHYYELMLRNKELTETRLQLVKSDEVERRLLAADLHDQVLNDLKALKQSIAEYGSVPSPELKQKIDTLLERSMSQVREVMDSLCPSALEHLGLTAALEDCLRRGAERGSFKPRFKSEVEREETDVLSPVEMSLLYRLFQESITNVIKHAQATKVRATVAKDGTALVLKIIDDGKGMSPDALQKDSRGLRYMRQRADLIGATVAWRPGEEGKGVEVEIRLDMAGRKRNANSDS